MPFTLIGGSFHVVGYSPDGDSIRFGPDNPHLLDSLSGPPARLNGRGHAQLRIEAIDALETHYSPPSGGGSYSQPLALANEARDALLDFLGITGVVWADGRNVALAADGPVEGYILARAVEKYGRPIAFVFAGSPPEPDGSSVRLEVPRLRQSFNYHALERGLAYPTFYEGLFHDLRDAMASAATDARASGRGLYASDATNSGVDVASLKAITDDDPIMPKLFRRLVEHVAFYGTVDGFKAKMEQYAEPVFDLEEQNFTHFDSFIDQVGTTVTLTRLPELLVFDAMPERPAETFSMLMGDETTHLD
ncbi:thermonuclease family protein [Bauldia litoralis]|uniref:Nuclease homologue n=1 Tax=Bauldia litoralis TaxID=665467 RepID=A0A1G6D371_9HYPH|nr:hypothetical protein [Bauldia litoralis]SDB39531.1 hypothetical protein SAMN02982931_02950 [Bauldia litoralis]